MSVETSATPQTSETPETPGTPETSETPKTSGTTEPDRTSTRIEERWRQERERRLNAVDALIGAEAALAQVRAENQELFYRLHVRETELAEATALLAEAERPPEPPDPTVDEAAGALARAVVGATRRRLRAPRPGGDSP